MIQPGSRNWIEKYFFMVEEGIIDFQSLEQPHYLSPTLFLHDVFFNSGIVFGFPSELLFFRDEKVTEKWTTDEKTVFLLFECLILVYKIEKTEFVKTEFVSALLNFYEQYKDGSSINVFKVLFKESDQIKLEGILKKRVHVKKTLSNQLWVNYLNNNLVYLDVLAFHSFLINKKHLQEDYDQLISGALNTIGAMSAIDHRIEDGEDQILEIYLSSSNMSASEKKELRQKIESKSLSIKDINVPKHTDELYKFYLIDMAILTVHSDLSAMNEELSALYRLCDHLEISYEQLKHSIILIERFMMKNNHRITFLQEHSAYEQLYGNFSKRWIKILGRNKDKFVEELRESKELISLVNKSLQQELTAEEKEKVKSQFKDLAKTLPALAIFMLPGGMLLLPLILKIVPDLIPSAFKINKTD